MNLNDRKLDDYSILCAVEWNLAIDKKWKEDVQRLIKEGLIKAERPLILTQKGRDRLLEWEQSL